MELTGLVTRGAVKSVWPRNMPTGSVEEKKLDLGDFAFDIEIRVAGRKRIPIAVERKRVSDLVQRSVSGDHWRQFMRLRDECYSSVILLENDTRTAGRFQAFGSQNLEGWKPTHTMIDDEKTIFLFFGRALLSSQSTRFVQTRDEISSLRAVAALGLMAAHCDDLKSRSAKPSPRVSNRESNLIDRLVAGGLPWQLAKHMDKSLGSVQHLESMYKACASDKCRSALLTPFIDESVSYNELHGTKCGWSDAIFRIMQATQHEATIARRAYEGRRQQPVDDHSKLLSALYSKASSIPVVDASKADSSCTKRHVTIEISEDKAKLFPAQAEDSFYALKTRKSNPMGLALPTIIMRTSCGKLASHRLFFHMLQAKSLVSLVTSRIPKSDTDFVAIAKDVAVAINDDCYSREMKVGKDTRVLLLCGLEPGLDAAAKTPSYRQETRVLVDMVLSQLMLAHGLVVIQAVRLSGDTELILQQLALSCFHYHLLFQEGQ